jgi:hypothetical protein
VVSIFEEHTDVIVKDRRDTHYGHKICLTGGASNLILDCVILEGNPADTDLVEQMLDRQKQIYGRYPLKGRSGRRVRLQRQLIESQRAKNQRRLFCQKTRFERNGHVPQRVRLQKAPTVSCRYRGRNILAQAQLRFDTLYLERVPFFQILCSVIGCCRQFANDGQKETGDRLD